MSSSLTRPAKRRKISTDEPPQIDALPTSLRTFNTARNNEPSPSATPRKLITYGSSKKQKLGPARSDAENQTPDLQEGVDAASKDSAYHSMSAPEELSEQEQLVKVSVKVSTKKKGQRGQVARTRSQKAAVDEEEETSMGVQLTPPRGERPGAESGGDGSRRGRLSSNRGVPRAYGKPVSNRECDQPGEPEEEIQESIDVRPDSAEEEEEPELNEMPLRSSARRRRPTKHYIETETAVSTPTKSPGRKRGRPPKSAMKTAKPTEAEVELQFEDIPKKAVLKTAGSGRKESSVLRVGPLPAETDSATTRYKRGQPLTEVSSPTGSAIALQSEDPQATMGHLRHLHSILRDKNMSEPFSLLRSQILDGLTGKRRLPLIGLDEEYQKVYQLTQQTVVAGEGNSMLVIGARGTAKTALVETVISQLVEDHGEEFYVVRLNGFIHTDDKLALKEIWRQLGKEMEVEEETTGMRSNYADTLTSLLALLSHPTEHSATAPDTAQTSKSVIFVMDEFDLFASHSRQTLLYNLFDIAQSRKAPIAVLGLTTKVNVVESLEKRVKSRFSHRYVYLSLPKTFTTFRDICKSALLCEATEATPIATVSRDFEAPQNLPNYIKLCTAWSTYMASLLINDPTITRLLRRIYAHTKSIPSALSAFLMPVLSMSPTSIPSPASFTSNPLLPPDSKLHLLPSLAEIELALLIAAARLDVILDTDTCNFNMAYDEYVTLASRAKLLSSASGAAALGGAGRVWTREVAIGAWERLEGLELLMPALGAGGGGGIADVGRAGRLWKVDVGLEEIGGARVEMSAVMAGWCRKI